MKFRLDPDTAAFQSRKMADTPLTPKEIEDFRKQFQRIVWQKGQVTKANDWIRNLTVFDKNGSHTKAINKTIERRNAEKKKLEEMMGGLTYDEWLKKSKRLSALNSRLAAAQKRVEQIKSEITKL